MTQYSPLDFKVFTPVSFGILGQVQFWIYPHSLEPDLDQSQGKGFNLKGAILDQMMPKSMDFNGFQ